MLTCCVCKQVIDNPELLFRHIKGEHKICGNNCKVQCTLCWKIFSNFSTFKTNVSKCFAEAESVGDIEGEAQVDPASYVYAVDTEMLNFEAKLRKSALKLACGLSAKMNWPRQDVFTTISELNNTYISEVISGIEEIIIPRVQRGFEENVENFIKAIRSSIKEVITEKNLEAALTKMDPLLQCEISEEKKQKKKRSRRKKRKVIQGTEETFSVDGRKDKRKRNEEHGDKDNSESSGESDGTEEGDIEIEKGDSVHNEASGARDETEEEVDIVKGTVIIMPIEFQIKKFFELPNVFEKVKRNTDKILEGTKIDHFIKGRLWKEKVKGYKPDQIVIPFHFYGDGAQMNNPMGPHFKLGEQQLNYYSFPTLPTEYTSRLENIFVAQIYPAKYHSDFSTEKVYNNIVDIFTTLAEDGIVLNINGENIHVFFVLGLFIGDSKEQNQRLGYVANFSKAHHCCRYCQMHIDEMRTNASSQQAVRRNRENYDIDVALGNETATGVKEYSIFNRIPYFHVTESSSADIAHDLTEGVHHTIFTNSISHFIHKKYFDLDYLNKRMRSIDFGEMENGNIPTEITIEKLNSGKLKMTSSEMSFFAHHFPLIIGDCIPDEDPVWQLVLTAIQFFDSCYLPGYDEDDIVALRNKNEELNGMLINQFGKDLKFKSHISTHYDELTLDYGPLRYVQTIKYEGKHKAIKSYAKNTNSRRNLPYSIAKKTQFNFAFRLLQGEGIDDKIDVPSYVAGFIETKVYYSTLLPSVNLDQISETECFFTKKMVLNGIIFSMELWLPNFEDENNKKINEIIDIVILELNEISKIFVVCKTYAVDFVEHYSSYRVKMETLHNNLSVINKWSLRTAAERSMTEDFNYYGPSAKRAKREKSFVREQRPIKHKSLDQQRIEKMENQLKIVMEENENSKAENGDLKRSNNILNDEAVEKIVRIEELVKQLKIVMEENENSKAENGDLKRSNNILNDEAVEKIVRIEELEKQLKIVMEENENSKAENSDLKRSNKILNDKAGEKNVRIEDLENQLKILIEGNENTKAENNILKQQTKEQTVRINHSGTELHQLNVELTKNKVPISLVTSAKSDVKAIQDWTVVRDIPQYTEWGLKLPTREKQMEMAKYLEENVYEETLRDTLIQSLKLMFSKEFFVKKLSFKVEKDRAYFKGSNLLKSLQMSLASKFPNDDTSCKNIQKKIRRFKDALASNSNLWVELNPTGLNMVAHNDDSLEASAQNIVAHNDDNLEASAQHYSGAL